MSSLQDLLTSYAVESGVIEDHAGNPEEFTVATMDTMTELETEIEDLSKKISDANADEDLLVKTSDAIVSVESIVINRMNQIRELGEEGHYSRSVQRMAWGGIVDSMEALGFPERLYSDITGDVSFESEEPKEQAEKDVEKGKSLLTRFWELLTGAARRVKELFVRFIDLFRKSAEKNQRSIDILGKEIQKRKGLAPKAGDMKTGAFDNLVVNKKVDPTSALPMLSKAMTSTLFPAQKKITEEVQKVYKILDGIRTNKGAIKNFLDKSISILGLKKDADVSAREILTGVYKSFPSDFNFDLAGGITAKFSSSATASGNLSIAFDISKPSEKAPETSPVPSIQELEAIHKFMGVTQGIIADSNKYIEEEMNVADKLIKTVQDLTAIKFDPGQESSVAKAIGGAAQSLSGVGKIFLPKINQYALTLQHSSYKYAMSALSRYSAKGVALAKDEEPAK